jgi:hypothetical protein
MRRMSDIGSRAGHAERGKREISQAARRPMALWQPISQVRSYGGPGGITVTKNFFRRSRMVADRDDASSPPRRSHRSGPFVREEMMSEIALTASEIRMKDYLVDAVVLNAKICGQWLKWSTINSKWRRMLGRAAANAVRHVPPEERGKADLAAVRFDAIMQKAAIEHGVAHNIAALMAARDAVDGKLTGGRLQSCRRTASGLARDINDHARGVKRWRDFAAGTLGDETLRQAMNATTPSAPPHTGFRPDDRVYVWGRLDERWIKCVGTVKDTHNDGIEFTVAFDGVGDVKGEEARMFGACLHHLGAESAPPCARQPKVIVKEEI